MGPGIHSRHSKNGDLATSLLDYTPLSLRRSLAMLPAQIVREIFGLCPST